jgi:hypothetical protein
MIYVVYYEEGIFKVKSKGLARKYGIQWIREFGDFYSAVEYAQNRC